MAVTGTLHDETVLRGYSRLISQYDPVNVASLTIALPYTSHNTFHLYMENIAPSAAGQVLCARLTLSTGYNVSNNYIWNQICINSANSTPVGSSFHTTSQGTLTYFQLSPPLSTAYGCSGEITISNGGANGLSGFDAHVSSENITVIHQNTLLGGVLWDGNTLTDITLFFISANITRGRFILYGLKRGYLP